MLRLAWGALVGVLVVGVLVIAGCGGGSSKTSATTATTGSGATTAPTFSGSSSSKYCDLARQLPTAINPNLTNNPQAAFQTFDAFAQQFLAVIPPQIKGDGETLVNGVKQLEASVVAVNYDLSKLTPTALAPVQTPAFAAASSAITTYDAQVCGVTATTPTT